MVEIKVKHFIVFYEMGGENHKVNLYGFHTVKEASAFFEENYAHDEYAISSQGSIKIAINAKLDFVQEFLGRIMEV